MIKILHKNNGYIVISISNSGVGPLLEPLHKLFLHGNLHGKPKDDVTWFIPFGEDSVTTLQRLIGHLVKYQLDFELDDESSATLHAVEEAFQKYKCILEDGLNAKKQITNNDLEYLRNYLRSNFKRELTILQLHSLNHLLHVQNGANLSVPGSGKTSVVLAYYHILRRQKVINAMLVIGPGSSFEPWESECRSCFKKIPRILRLAGKPKLMRREAYLLATRYQILLTTYHSAARDTEYLTKLLRNRDFLVVLDESHYVKRPQHGILADAVLRLAPNAKRRVILTGTPMPNGLADLWTQFTFLWYKQLPLGKVTDYLREIQEKDRLDALSDVRKKISPLFYRVTKRELELPRPTFHIIKCRMSPLQARIYRGVATRFLLQSNEAPDDRESLREWRRSKAVRLLQIASNPALLRSNCDEFRLPPLDLKGIPLRDAIEHYASYELPSKIEHACELVKSICKQGRKVIIWSTFVHNLTMISKQLKEFPVVVVHGGIPMTSSGYDEFDREHLIHKFKTDPKILVLIANPAACAESISLHKVCSNAIYIDRSFNCAHYLQSLDRIHRLGLSPSDYVGYYLLLSKNSVDETVQSRLREKMQNMRNVIEAKFPGEVPGFWSNDLGEEEERDFDLVDKHIVDVAKDNVRKT